jgi:predicted dehydrogenase
MTLREIRFAFIGFGNIAKTHLVALRAMPIVKNNSFVPVLDTLVTRNPDANRAQAEAIGFKHVTSDLNAALSERNIDVIDICTPNAMHVEPFMAALQASKSIYCEKPLTDRYDRSAKLAEALKTDSKHQVALVYRYHPAVLRIREVLSQGTIGKVLQARCSYRRSGYLNASRPVSWRLDERLTGGGAISDLGVHVLDLLYHLFGEFEHVSGETNVFVKKRPSSSQPEAPMVDMQVDDWADMKINHINGVKSTGEVSRIAWGNEAFQLDIVGTLGTISCDLEKEYMPRIKLLDGSSPAVPSPATLQLTTDDKSTMGMGVDCHFAALHHFMHRITGSESTYGDLAPTVHDCLRAEHWIDQVLRANEVK